MRLFGFTGGDGVNGSLELELLQYWLYQYRLFIVKLHIDLIAYENWFLDKSCGGNAKPAASQIIIGEKCCFFVL